MKKLLLCSLTVAFTAVLACQAPADTLYSNGSDASTSAYTAYGFSNASSVSDSFTLAGPATFDSALVQLATSTGTAPTTLRWQIGTTAFGSDISAGTVTLTNTAVGSYYSSTFTLSGTAPSAATYYFTLSEGTLTGGPFEFVYWVESDGPSVASQSDGSNSGSIPSEAFTLFGTYAPGVAAPEPSTWAMLGAGALSFGTVALRRKAQKI